MKCLRWVAVLIMLAFCGALSFADSAPPDGNIGTKNGGSSIPVTSLTQPLTFSPCLGATGNLAFDCALFGTPQPQQIFAGINETGYAWNTISIFFSNYNPSTDPNVTCDGGAIFQTCSAIPTGPSTLKVTFNQGTGTGVGCYGNASTDLACGVNSALAILSNEFLHTNLPYSLLPPAQMTGPCITPEHFPRGAVCGSDEFMIGIGYGTDSHGVSNAFVQSLSLDAGFAANNAAPEPQTFVLVGGAMLAMLLLGIRKAGQV